MTRTFYEFFAGGGMARLGLGTNWSCIFANDIDPKKRAIYEANFGKGQIHPKDVNLLEGSDLPGRPDLAWASFPCQDLSLAGNRQGLKGERSGTFWGFWSAISSLKLQGRQPPVLALENVVGTLTSHGGRDFEEIVRSLVTLQYRVGAVVADAIHFLPQSRPRLFIICVHETREMPSDLLSPSPSQTWHTPALREAFARLPSWLQAKWMWWNLPQPAPGVLKLEELVEWQGANIAWHSSEETARLVAMMSEANRHKLEKEKRKGEIVVGAVYKRTRPDERGVRRQRAEVRFDGVAGCLRTPGGGSSRQILLFVEGDKLRSRLMTVREAARLMGVPDSYVLPESYNDGYHVFGDGLAVPVVNYLARCLLDAIVQLPNNSRRTAA